MTGPPGPLSGAVLVTGAAGFVGLHVTRLLLRQGCAVVALLRSRTLPPDLQAQCKRVIAGDICDRAVQSEALRDVEAVCHLSAHIPSSLDDLNEAVHCYRTNAQAVLELASVAAQRGVRRFVHVSTANMYSYSNTPCDEDASLFPANYATGYFASKIAAELYLTRLCRDIPMDQVILRMATPYGPGEPRQKVIPTFLRRASAKETLRLVNGGTARLNFVYVEDVAGCIVRAIEDGPPGIYNVASGESTTLLDLARAALDAVDEPDGPVEIEPPSGGGSVGFSPVSIQKARQTWGYAPRRLPQGLRVYRTESTKAGRPS
jgi:UDP-glucose 4-epimerase